MTFAQFKHLSEADQEFILWTRGVVISERVEYPFRFVLHQVDAFYIEVKYRLPFSIITGLLFFDQTDRLEPYLRQIDIAAIYT